MKLKKEYKELCRKLREGHQGKRGQPIDPNPHIDYEALVKYLLDEGRREQTIKDYLLWIHKFQADVNEENLKDWRSHVFVRNESSQEAKIRLNYLVYNVLKKYLKAIDREGLLDVLPDTNQVPKVKTQPKFKGIGGKNPKEIENRWKGLLDILENGVIRDTTILMRELGLRVGEVMNMRKNWIAERGNEKIIFIPKKYSKSRRDEEVPLDKKNYNILKKHIKNKKDNDLVFTITDEKGKQRKLNYNDYVLAYDKVFENTRMKIHPHLLRHQFAHDLERAGFLGSEIQLLMRHSDISTTGRYLQKEKKKVRKKFYKMKEKDG